MELFEEQKLAKDGLGLGVRMYWVFAGLMLTLGSADYIAMLKGGMERILWQLGLKYQGFGLLLC